MHRLKRDTPDRMEIAWRHHERRWKDNRYVYAVVSRRSRGISIGLNLNPDKRCNFDCIYCQVDRRLPSNTIRINLRRLTLELERILSAEQDGSLYEDVPFSALAPAERGVRDIAFSGDGEPTTYGRFMEAVQIAASARLRFKLDSTKLVLLTNATGLNLASVRAALSVMDKNMGEIWTKLDAGTPEYFRTVSRSHWPLEQILRNILDAARIRPLVIQSLWLRVLGAAPSAEEVEAYCNRINNLVSEGAQLKAIQLHTIARDPADAGASALSRNELDRVASIVVSRVAVPVEVF